MTSSSNPVDMLVPAVTPSVRPARVTQLNSDQKARTAEFPVLVTDDDTIVLTLYRVLLSRAGVNAIYTPNAHEALEWCRTRRLSAIITDIYKPEMSGLELLTLIRGDPATAGMPAAIITASSSMMNVQRAHQLNAAIMTKPIEPRALIDLLADLLQNNYPP